MNFVFTGFRQANAVRQFAFDCVADDKTRTTITVGADLALARKHEILLQDLPLLCLRMLELKEHQASAATVTFTEANMIAVEAAVKLAKAEKKAPRRPVPSEKIGQAWR